MSSSRRWVPVTAAAVALWAAVLADPAGAGPVQARSFQSPHASPAPAYPALGELGAARRASAGVLRFDAEVVLGAAREEVWAAWTTGAGLRSWCGPGARVSLAVGGVFEAGGPSATPAVPSAVGSSGPAGPGPRRILSYVPGGMLSFSYPAHPAFARPREARTAWSVVHFEALGPVRTRVRYTGLELDLGPDFRESHMYSRVRVMSHTLRDLAARFGGGRSQWPQRAPGH